MTLATGAGVTALKGNPDHSAILDRCLNLRNGMGAPLSWLHTLLSRLAAPAPELQEPVASWQSRHLQTRLASMLVHPCSLRSTTALCRNALKTHFTMLSTLLKD